MNMRILFCNIAWMKYYKGIFDDDIPQHGGSYVEKTHDAWESINFLPVINITTEEYYCYGNYATKSTNGIDVNEMHIENIDGCQSAKNAELVDGVLVVWCARSYTNESVIVGWYKNATVFRKYQELDLEFEEGDILAHGYNIMAKAEDCVLLPEGTRNRHIWVAARAHRKGRTYGFGRANVWYAKEKSAESYIEKLMKNINGYAGDN